MRINRAVYNALLVLILSISSACIYFLQIILFNNPADTYFYLFQDLAFVPIQALVVTLVLNKLLNMLERQKNPKKVNVIMSTYFAEAGTSIILELSRLVKNTEEFCEVIKITELNKNNISTMKKKINDFNYDLSVTPEKIENLKLVLDEKKSFMIGLLQSPNLLEHDAFTDMLWSVFHIADELQSRDSLQKLTQDDLEHLKIDILRAYRLIVLEWVKYMKYLKAEYPYLYNLAIRKTPFSFAVKEKVS